MQRLLVAGGRYSVGLVCLLIACQPPAPPATAVADLHYLNSGLIPEPSEDFPIQASLDAYCSRIDEARTWIAL